MNSAKLVDCAAKVLLGSLVWVWFWGGGSVSAATFELPPPGESVVGHNIVVRASGSGTVLDIARRHDIGYREIKAANPSIDLWMPEEGARILIPNRYVLPRVPRQGIVINLAELRLYYYPTPPPGQEAVVITHPIGVGRKNWHTPLGKTTIIDKTRNPTWNPPKSIRIAHAAHGDPLPRAIPPGPNNPLGKFALRLGMPGYLIHGTNRPRGVGMRVSHGCIRLYPEDIAQLFKRVEVGTPVHIIYQPLKAGMKGGELYIEAHPPFPEREESRHDGLTDMVAAIVAVTENSLPDVSWETVRQVVRRRTGVATQASGVDPGTALMFRQRPF